MTEPLLRRLHARGERLTVAALPWVAPVYRAMPQVAEVIELAFPRSGLQWRARRAMARRLRGRFQRAYVCPNSFKSGLIPFWAGIPERIGYLGEARWWLLNRRLPNPAGVQRPPMVDFYAALAQVEVRGQAQAPAAGTGSGSGMAAPRLAPDASRQAQALHDAGLQAGAYYVFAPGAEYGPAKRWPPEYFAQLACRLEQPVVLLGSSKDAPVCAGIAAHIRQLAPHQQCIDLAGRTPLDQALAIIAAARAVVSNDSGLMHVAAAFSVPQVAVFGSSSPRHTPPLSARARVVWLQLDCAPCFARECPLGHTRCLTGIAPETVLAQLGEALAAG